jgi:hypothetical protein
LTRLSHSLARFRYVITLSAPNAGWKGNEGRFSGGRAFSVENINKLPDIATKIGSELRKQYILGFRPVDKSRGARWRKITIKLRAPGDCCLAASPRKQVTTVQASKFPWMHVVRTLGRNLDCASFALL